MNDFLEMNVFFFVTTICVVLLTGMVVILVMRVIRLLGKVEDGLDVVKSMVSFWKNLFPSKKSKK